MPRICLLEPAMAFPFLTARTTRIPWRLLGGFLLAAALLAPGASTAHGAAWRARIASLAGPDGVVYAADERDAVVVSVNGERSFTPASTLKIITTLLALEYLGPESRFTTEFYVDGDVLVARGKGDPFLVSEELEAAAAALAVKLHGKKLRGVAVDDSYFSPNIAVPGVGDSSDPYNAPNSATGVNFNTVHLRVTGAQVSSAEPHTPVTPLAAQLVRRYQVRGTARVHLSQDAGEVRRYAAELIAAKLRQAGVTVGGVLDGRAAPAGAPLYVHRNSRTVAQVCAAMLRYSNNYVANQLFLAVGAAVYGAPANLDKSRRVAATWLARHPRLHGIVMVEGSGISYRNRATAPALAHALRLLAPHRDLLHVQHGSPSKTGTLQTTRSVVGYLDTGGRGTLRYVISLGGNGYQRRWEIVKVLQEALGTSAQEHASSTRPAGSAGGSAPRGGLAARGRDGTGPGG